MMRAGIYAAVTPDFTSGVGRYLKGLLIGLSRVDRENEYLLYHAAEQTLPALPPNFRLRPIPVNVRARVRNHLFQALWLPWLAARQGATLVHVPNSMPILYRRRPVVVTIFDLAEYALPQRVYAAGRHAYRRLAHRLAARAADLIITPSENTRRDVVRYLGGDPARVQVIYPGIDHGAFRPLPRDPQQQAEVARRLGLPARYLLYTGKLQPRKNLVRLLRAFHQLVPAHPDLRLVVTGGRGWMNADISATISVLGLAPALHFTGWVADDMLPALYGLAALFVFPSLYEGFGFPVLEAMACGTPVVTSATSSLAEIAGDAAVCVDPSSVEQIAAAIGRLLNDNVLRDDLRARGLAHARRFTWERCAAETKACYQRLSRGVVRPA